MLRMSPCVNVIRCGSRARKAGCLGILLLILGSALALAGDATTPQTTPSAPSVGASAKLPWGRIVMIGASASAGFTESEPLGGPKTLQSRPSYYLDAALSVAHEPVQNL